jgi:predicted HAD superfamily phosphohydrolase YqeG
MGSLVPVYRYQSVAEIDFALINKPYWAFDRDQTVMDKDGNFGENLEAIRKAIIDGDIKRVAILTNGHCNRELRLEISNLLGVSVTFVPLGLFRRKPRQWGFNQVQEKFNCSPEELVMVGDQLVSDIKGGNEAGFVTVLVEPFGEYSWSTVVSLRKVRNNRARRELPFVLQYK